MEKNISFRHNVLRLDSSEMFINIRGGYNNFVRDVYFVREIGESEHFEQMLRELDQKMSVNNSPIKYVKTGALQAVDFSGNLDFYIDSYAKWKKGEPVCLKNGSVEGTFANVLNQALILITENFSTYKKNVTDSMERNFIVKMLYWLDNSVFEFITPWSEQNCVKIVTGNIVKEHEYLFFLMLTYLGCDVLMIQNQTDVESEELRKYSNEIHLGDYGMTDLTMFFKNSAEDRTQKREKNDAVKEGQSQEVKTNQECTNKVVIPKEKSKHVPGGNRSVESKPVSGRIQNGNPNREKNFEELAQLAEAVVMIAIHDKNGDVIGTGSGIMIGRKGFILTNNHVAARGVSYSVKIEDDDEVYATDELIKYNSDTDLAVIRIKRQLNPIPIYRRDQKLVRGQKVVAIGSPLGLFNSVSDGIISGFRNIDGVEMIQFTAPISHGSSGGAVLNMQGEVIGISTAGIDRGQNINLAVGYENIRMFAKGFFEE